MAHLLGDIGGTKSRFALLDAAGEIVETRTLRNADHDSLAAAAEEYLSGLDGGEETVQRGALAVATPIRGDSVHLTNRDWSFSISALRHRLGLDELKVLNDFEALALAVAHLDEAQAPLLKPGEAVTGAPLAVLGPGTGLGMAAALPTATGWRAVAGEGGHQTLAAATAREWEVRQVLARRFGHVSWERAVSGPGLLNLYQALCELDGVREGASTPSEVDELAASDPHAKEAVELFSALLGAAAGDLALTVGARGGVYLGGGVLPAMGDTFPRDPFRARFADKGRFASYLEPIPVRLVVHPTPALIGLAHLLGEASPTA